jgi:hypothetical protein
MRVVLLTLCLLLFGVSAGASEPVQCKNLKGQLDHYQMLRERADAANSALWEQRLDQQLAHLKKQSRSMGCKDTTAALEKTLAEMRALLKLAMQGALTFFTMGAM